MSRTRIWKSSGNDRCTSCCEKSPPGTNRRSSWSRTRKSHSEVVLEEALGRNVTLLLGGRPDNLAGRPEIRNALTYYGAEHYVRAVQHGYVLYVEGTTDLDILREFAVRLGHPAATRWDERINAFYVADSHPRADLDVELERVEGGYGRSQKPHFFALRDLVRDCAASPSSTATDRSGRTPTKEGSAPSTGSVTRRRTTSSPPT